MHFQRKKKCTLNFNSNDSFRLYLHLYLILIFSILPRNDKKKKLSLTSEFVSLMKI